MIPAILQYKAVNQHVAKVTKTKQNNNWSNCLRQQTLTLCIRSWDKTQQHLKALHLITIFLSGRVSHFNDSKQGANLPRFLTGTTLRIRSSSLSVSAIRHPIPLPLLSSSPHHRQGSYPAGSLPFNEVHYSKWIMTHPCEAEEWFGEASQGRGEWRANLINAHITVLHWPWLPFACMPVFSVTAALTADCRWVYLFIIVHFLFFFLQHGAGLFCSSEQGWSGHTTKHLSDPEVMFVALPLRQVSRQKKKSPPRQCWMHITNMACSIDALV